MKDRIILLIKAKNLTAAQFADEIGVQKSSISHILSGRNNASLDFIQKVLSCYPEVNMEWLMFGKGPLFRSAGTNPNTSTDVHSDDVLPQHMPPVDLFSDLTPGNRIVFSKENEFNMEATTEEKTKQGEIDGSTSFPVAEDKRKISASSTDKSDFETVSSGHKHTTTKTLLKIVEFYTDNTYREFFPG